MPLTFQFLLPLFTARRKRHTRGNRLIGRIWLFLLLSALLYMNYLASRITPFIGHFARIYTGALICAAIWNTVLIGAIWFRQGWARFILSALLMVFALGQIACLPDALYYYPALFGTSVKIVVLLNCTNCFATILLMASKHIRSLGQRHVNPPMIDLSNH